MDDKQAQDMNALELAAFNDPVNFLNTQQNPRKWTLTADEIAQSYSVTPAQLLHTDELSEPKWNVAETLARELWNGAASMFESAAEGVANDKLNQVIYRSNNMDKEDADRLIEDVLRSQVLSRNRQNLEDARQVHDKWSSGIGNGIGSVLSMALVGYATKSPAAVGVLTGLGEKYNARNEMIDRYVNEEGTTEGVAGKLGEYNALSTAYGLFSGAVEASIGVERLAAGSLNRYGKLAALQRLARQQGRYGEALAYKTGREVVASGAEEFGEEFLQSIGEDVAVSLVQDMWEDPDLNKALTQGMFGAIIGAPSGAIFYNGSRKKIIDYINKWNKDKNAGLSDGQVVQMTDEILHNGTHRMLDDITTNVEIRQHFGKAYDLVKQRLTELIDATGTTPWTDKNKSKEQYIQDLADTITIPAINMANKLHIPMSEFLEIADIDTASISGNNIWLKPITSVADLDALIAEQDAIIKDQREKKKLGVGDDTLLNRARTRKAMAERAKRDFQVEDAIRTHRTNRRKEKADYITAKDLQPDQVNTLSGAQQATTGQDYVLFGGQRIPVEYEVVELSEIQSSHIDGEINPNYTNKELQNRASRGTTQDVADLKEKASNITPERLLRASTSAEGAPVVNARGEVIAGNGRTEIIRYAYQNPESAEKYKQALVAEGYNIDGMQQPILIRRNTTMTDQEQVAAADISNISETSAFDEASQARMDTKYLKDSKDDVEFASKLPMSERRGLMQNNGKWNKRRVRQRYEDALLAWLCGNDTQLFETMVLDRNLAQKVIDILTTNGSLVYETATKYPELEIREDIYHALVKMQVATRDNFIELTQQLELDGHDVMPENIIVWNWLFADPTTNRQFLSNYVTTLANNQDAVNAGQDMFGQTVPELSKKDALIQALKKADQAKAETAASRGREYAPLFDENGTATDANLAAAIISYQNQFAQETEGPTLFQKRGVIRGFYDPELQTITLTKYWNETTLVHEFHHRYLEKLFNYFKQAQTGERAVSDEYMVDMQQLFSILNIDPTQDALTTVQQEKFATMVEAYITGLGVDNPENLAFQSFLHWIPEQYKSIMNIGYLDENNNIVNPILDEQTIAWFNKWFANPFAPSLASSPEAQKLVNPTDNNGEIIPSKQKTMNDREKDWGIDSEEQNKADAQLWRAIGENTPTNMRAAMDGEKEHMKAESKNLPDDTKLPETHKPTMREKWFKTYQPNARERAAQMAREYLSKNPEHARELAFADPETGTEYDAPVDRGMLIRAVMETVPHGSDEWYILNDNLATVKSMSGSTLSLSGDQSHRAYLEAKREVEAARELKAAVNYAGTRNGAIDKWNNDIKAFVAKNATAILATEPNSKERQVAIKAFLEEAKTKFSGNTTDAVLNQLDLTGMQTKNSQAFIKWAEKQIKQAAHAKMDTAEQKELMKASIAAQLALQEIDSTAKKDGMFARATQAAKDIRHWQFVKDKMKKAYIGRWGKFGIFMDNLFGSYAPSAMLMSVNTLFFANVPSTAINTAVVRQAAKTIGKNNVDQQVLNDEKERIKQIFNASGVNLAQMEKPSSPSTLHGEKYMNTEQKHWYNFTFEILGRTDNVFRIPTFVDALARIATKNAGGDKAKATALFKEYAKINNQSDDAKIARKQALAVANMAVFTQDGMLSSALNHIRSNLNTLSRGMLGLDPNGFGLGNILAPFLKTGANVVEMGFTGMLAPIRSIGMGLQKLQGKEIPDIKKIALRADWINFALTAVMVALMAALSGDDDWYEEPYQSGKQYDPDKPYDSIKIGGVWVKVDVFGPIAIPLRTAAMGIKDWEKRKFAAIGDGLFEALSDTPLVQQFTDSSLDYMMKKPGAYWSGFAYNQANKLVPAQLKTISKAASRGLGIEKDTSWAGKTIGRKLHRNYGFDGERLTTNDLINVLTNRLKYQPE